jgi:hypothetical protein
MKKMLLTLILVATCRGAVAGAPDLPNFIAPQHSEAIQAWLDAHPLYRLAADDDCKCDEDIGPPGARETHPYFAVGDFDGDGIDDFAVVAIPKQVGPKIMVVVFFGSASGFGRDSLEIPLQFPNVLSAGLFVGKSHDKAKGKRSILGYGAFESEWEELSVNRRGPRASQSAQGSGK